MKYPSDIPATLAEGVSTAWVISPLPVFSSLFSRLISCPGLVHKGQKHSS